MKKSKMNKPREPPMEEKNIATINQRISKYITEQGVYRNVGVFLTLRNFKVKKLKIKVKSTLLRVLFLCKFLRR